MKTILYYLSNKKKNEMISLSCLKDTIRYKHLLANFPCDVKKNEVVNIFSATSVSPYDHNYYSIVYSAKYFLFLFFFVHI